MVNNCFTINKLFMITCCVFGQANECSACHSLVEINYFDTKTTFSVTNRTNKEKRKECHTKTCNKRRVYQQKGVTLLGWLTPKSWSTPERNVIFFLKSCFSIKKMILISARRASTRSLVEIHNNNNFQVCPKLKMQGLDKAYEHMI